MRSCGLKVVGNWMGANKLKQYGHTEVLFVLISMMQVWDYQSILKR